MATRTAKKTTAKKVTAKAKTTAKKVTTKAKATAKKVTTKAKAKKVTTANIDFTDSIQKIKKTAINVNSQVMDTAGDVAVDLRSNGEQMAEVAVAKAKEAIYSLTDKVSDVRENLTERAINVRENLTERVSEVAGTVVETVNMETITDTAKNLNKYTLKTAEEIVDGAIVNGEKWQGITTKAVKGGLKLAAKNQDIMFDTLETVKDQLTVSAKRFKKLFQSK